MKLLLSILEPSDHHWILLVIGGREMLIHFVLTNAPVDAYWAFYLLTLLSVLISKMPLSHRLGERFAAAWDPA